MDSYWSPISPTGIYYNENVGISTNNPLTQLDVNGDVNVRGKIEGFYETEVVVENVSAYNSVGGKISYYDYNPFFPSSTTSTGYSYILFPIDGGSFVLTTYDTLTVNYVVIGGGGGGGYGDSYGSNGSGGGGGGGGETLSSTLTLTKDTVYSVVVGTGGLNITSGDNAGAGSFSSISQSSTVLIVAGGGEGGTNYYAEYITVGGGSGGDGGNDGGDGSLTGNNGGNGTNISFLDGLSGYFAGGGAGGGNTSHDGGLGGGGNSTGGGFVGSNATYYGGGGGGGGFSGSTLYNGGNGYQGAVMIYFPKETQITNTPSIVEVSGNLVVYGNATQSNILVRNVAIPTTANTNHYIAASVNNDFQYQLISTTEGALYLSKDNGKSFSVIMNNNVTYNWNCLAMSGNGQYMLAGVYYYSGQPGGNSVYQSRNYGETWNWVRDMSYNYTYNIGTVVISNDGKYQLVIISDGENYDYRKSTDYGATFTSLTKSTSNGYLSSRGASSYNGYYMAVPFEAGYKIALYTNYLASWANNSNAQFGVGLAMSGDGKYTTECMGYTSTTYTFITNNNFNNNSNYNTTIYINGVIQSATNRYNVTSVSMDASGQFQVACAGTGEIFISSDYGINWDTLLVDSTQIWTSIVLSQKVDLSNNFLTFLVGSTTGLFTFNVNSSIYALNVIGSSLFQNNVIVNGDVYANNFYNTSDYRIKDVLSELDDERDKIDLLRTVKYQNLLNKNIEYGFIAHELQEIFPNLVTGEKDADDLQKVNYIGIISLLIKEIHQRQKMMIQNN